VLFIVAVVTALVSFAAIGFLFSMRTENVAAHLQADQMQVDQITQSGVEYLRELTLMPEEERATLGGLDNNPSIFRDVRVDFDLVANRHGRFCVLRPSYADDSSDAVFHFGVHNESAKLNLAALLRWDSEYPGLARRALMNLPGMTQEVADAILDSIDADDQPREFGAEAEFYMALDPPRQPANRVPDQIEGLLAVRGVTLEQLLGSRRGMNLLAATTDVQASVNPLPAGDPQLSRRSTVEAPFGPAPPWSYYLTVYNAERNRSASGQPRINLNQPDLLALRRELATEFDQETANFVAALRRYGPSDGSFESSRAEAVPLQAISGAARFELSLALDLVDSVVEIPAPTDANEAKSIRYRSPFASRDPASLQALVRFLDRTTTTTIERFEGRIDLRTAPRPVLLGIPGLTPEQVDRIVTARQRPFADDTSRSHAAWLLAEGVVDLETMKNIDRFVTVGGDVLRAEVVAYYDPKAPWARLEIVVDGTRDDAPIVYAKDLRRLGRGFRYQELVWPESVDAVNGRPSDHAAGPQAAASEIFPRHNVHPTHSRSRKTQ
jgi:hypothetical protein